MFDTFVYTYLFILCMSALEKCLFKSYAHFSIGFFFATKVDEFLICCRYQPFIRGMFFSNSVGCLFVWLIVSDVQKLHSWVQSPFSIFSLVACVIQNNFANITSRSFYLGVLFFPLSCLSLNSNLELIHEWYEIGIPFSSHACGHPAFPTLFI